MDIKLSPEAEQRMKASIQRFVAEAYGVDLGDLGAGTFLAFCLKELGPDIYHQAIADAQACLQERVTDLENICFVDPGGYWDAPRRVPRKPAPRR